jgi:hypothetical protein
VSTPRASTLQLVRLCSTGRGVFNEQLVRARHRQIGRRPRVLVTRPTEAGRLQHTGRSRRGMCTAFSSLPRVVHEPARPASAQGIRNGRGRRRADDRRHGRGLNDPRRSTRATRLLIEPWTARASELESAPKARVRMPRLSTVRFGAAVPVWHVLAKGRGPRAWCDGFGGDRCRGQSAVRRCRGIQWALHRPALNPFRFHTARATDRSTPDHNEGGAHGHVERRNQRFDV